jgi:hypothetical protein
MNRQAIIISNPGEGGEENYCGGVAKDVANYRSFLLSAIGGAWQESEIAEMSRPSVAELRRKIGQLSSSDYALVVFAGHGYHDTGLDSTILELRRGEEVDSADLRAEIGKQTIILDCCRRKVPATLLTEARDALKFAKTWPAINRAECRYYYDKRLAECPDELVVMYACAIDQLAGDDDQKGGIYSYSLLEASKAWASNSTTDTSRSFAILSVVSAHEKAVPLVQRARGGRQTPHIEKPRSDPYYPFCVVA